MICYKNMLNIMSVVLYFYVKKKKVSNELLLFDKVKKTIKNSTIDMF